MVAPHADADLEHDPIRLGGEVGESGYERFKLITRLFLGEEAQLRIRSDSPEFASGALVPEAANVALGHFRCAPVALVEASLLQLRRPDRGHRFQRLEE